MKVKNRSWRKHLVLNTESIAFCLNRFNELAANAVVFIVDQNDILVGSLTDGDIRRGFLKGLDIHHPLTDFIKPDPKFVLEDEVDIKILKTWRELNFMLIPVLNKHRKVVDVINFKEQRSYLPCRALIMAGGKGERLRPLTASTPKPLLKVGNWPIIEHNIRRLHSFGIVHFYVSVHYLSEQIVDFLTHLEINAEFTFINEEIPLGTIGAMGLIEERFDESLFILNADILHEVNFEEYFLHVGDEGADIAVLGLPYQVNVPFAVLESQRHQVMKLSEKPTYTYLVNGGVYWCKNQHIFEIEKNVRLDATDWMDRHIEKGNKVVLYPFYGYWKDIGRMEDFIQVQEDIKRLTI